MKAAPDATLPTDPLVFRVLTEIGIIAQLSRTTLERATPDGVSGAGFGVLNHLARHPEGSSPARLARAFEVTKGAMTNTLQRLEGEGLVRIVANPADARAKHVTATKQGLKARDAIIASLAPGMKALSAAVPASLLAELLPRLAALRAVMDRDALS